MNGSLKRRQFSLAQLLLITMLGACLGTYYSAVLRTGLENYHVWDVVISPDGKWLAHGSTRGLVVFDLQSGKKCLTTKDAGNPAFSPNERLVAFSQGGRAEVWDLGARKLVKSWSKTGDYPRSLAFSADGTFVIDWFGTIERWSLPDGKQSGAALIRDRYADAVCHSSDAIFAAVGNSSFPGYRIEVWDCRSSTLMRTMSGSEYTTIREVAFSPDNKSIAAAMGDGIQLWNRESGHTVARLKAQEVCCVAFSSTGDLIASVDQVGNVRVWSPKSEEVSIVGQVGQGWSSDVHFAGSDQELRAAGENGTAKIIDIGRRETIRRYSGLHLPPPTPSVLWYLVIVIGAAWLILWCRIKPRRDDSTAEHGAGDMGWGLILITAIVTFVLPLPFVHSASYLNLPAIYMMIGGSAFMLVAILGNLNRFRYNALCLTFSICAHVAVLFVGCCLFFLAWMYRAD